MANSSSKSIIDVTALLSIVRGLGLPHIY